MEHALLGELDLLAAVVTTGSFVRAGERLGLTQSGVSRAVSRLEQHVGVRLFDRNARAVTLTDEGRRFYDRVAPLADALADALDDVAGSAVRVRGRLRVDCDAFFARYALGPRVDRFLARYPELALEILVRDQQQSPLADGFDIAIRFGDPHPSSLVARRLLRTRIVTCAAPSYLARRGHPEHPRELAGNHECILFVDPNRGRPFDWEFHQGRRRLRVDVRGRLVVNDVTTAVEACIGGHGIAQLMELGTRALVRKGTLVELFPRWRDELFPLYVFHPSRHLPPAKVRAFVDFVVESARDAR
jgi:DNA-binding transcriptional LysR family regulator